MVLTKFEKSEQSIRLSDKMDRMDRTWELFKNSIIRSFILNYFIFLIYYLLYTNEKLRFMIRMARRILYYFVILASAFLLTRDDLSHNWRLDWRDTNMEVNEFSKHLMEYIILFFIMNI